MNFKALESEFVPVFVNNNEERIYSAIFRPLASLHCNSRVQEIQISVPTYCYVEEHSANHSPIRWHPAPFFLPSYAQVWKLRPALSSARGLPSAGYRPRGWLAS